MEIRGWEEIVGIVNKAIPISPSIPTSPFLTQKWKKKESPRAETLSQRPLNIKIRIKDMQLTREETRKAVEEDSGLLEIIRFAIDREREAQELYEDGYRYAKNKTAKELFRLLLEEEISHEKRLDKVYKEIKDFLNRG